MSINGMGQVPQSLEFSHRFLKDLTVYDSPTREDATQEIVIGTKVKFIVGVE